MPSKTLHQIISFKTITPKQVYDALMTSKQHAAFTGDDASISTKVGGKFFAYGDYISGKNLALVPSKKIVQEWHSSDWEKGITSIVTFVFTKTPTGTKLDFTHENIPADDFANIKQGWVDYYWTPLKAYLQNV